MGAGGVDELGAGVHHGKLDGEQDDQGGGDGEEDRWDGSEFGGDVSWRPLFVAGREPLWRDGQCAQLGHDRQQAMAIDGLSPPLAQLVTRLDGTRTVRRLVVDAVAAGVPAEIAAGLLTDLASAGLIEDAGPAKAVPRELAADTHAWHARCGGSGRDLVERRSAATVEVHGSGRVAMAVALVLTVSGVGNVVPRPTGVVDRGDVGLGYRGEDVGRRRATAAAAAVRRHRVVSADPGGRTVPDVAVVADAAVHDALLATRLVSERIPHVAVQVTDGRALVGPVVLPGGTGCLRCVDLYRSDEDPCWPRLAAQLAGRSSHASLAGTAVAAGLAAEQVLALLAGAARPGAVGVTIELDPLTGRTRRHRRPAHPACGCGAVATIGSGPARTREPQHAG